MIADKRINGRPCKRFCCVVPACIGHGTCLSDGNGGETVSGQFAFDVEPAPTLFHVVGKKAVAMIEQCDVEPVEGIECAMDVAVVLTAGGDEIAHDRFVLHACESHDIHAHRVEHGGRMGDFAGVALRCPAETSAGGEVAVVIEQGGDCIVKAVGVVVGEPHGLLGDDV